MFFWILRDNNGKLFDEKIITHDQQSCETSSQRQHIEINLEMLSSDTEN